MSIKFHRALKHWFFLKNFCSPEIPKTNYICRKLHLECFRYGGRMKFLFDVLTAQTAPGRENSYSIRLRIWSFGKNAICDCFILRQMRRTNRTNKIPYVQNYSVTTLRNSGKPYMSNANNPLKCILRVAWNTGQYKRLWVLKVKSTRLIVFMEKNCRLRFV